MSNLTMIWQNSSLPSSLLISIFTIQLLLASVDGANILGIFPFKAKSHVYFNEAIMKTLADAGHRVTFIAPLSSNQEITNFRIIDSRINKSNVTFSTYNRDHKTMSYFEYLRIGTDIIEKDCYDFLNNPEIINIISTDFQFDLMIVELLPMFQCYLPLAKQYGIPVIGTSPLRQFHICDLTMGNPHPLTFPFQQHSFPNPMTFYQRLLNAYYHLFSRFFHVVEVRYRVQKILSKYYPSYDLDVDKRISLLFLNNHASILPVPLVPSIIEVGGLHIKELKPLPQNFKKFIEDAKNGVILFSLGTISGDGVIDSRLREIFRSTFAQIPQRVIWKCSSPIENLSINVLKVDWMPQIDILAHENVKAFISHCGISSTYESVYAAKPMVLMPVVFDQHSNAESLEGLGVGVKVDIRTLTKDKLLHAINEVIYNEKYKKNMQKVSHTFRDRPMDLQQSVLYWTEYVIKYNGTAHLESPGKNMPLYQYLLLDVALVVIATLLLLLWTFYYFLKVVKMLFCELVGLSKKRIGKNKKNQ